MTAPHVAFLIRLVFLFCLMLLFTLIGLRRFRARPDFPDSVYFMGFIWSVFVLAFETAMTGYKNTSLSTKDLQSLFGYSLATTGAGMFVRVILQQYEGDRFAAPSVAQSHLTATLDLSSHETQLRLIAQHFEVFEQRIARALERSSEDIEKAAERFASVADKTAQEARDSIHRQMQSACDDVKSALTKPIDHGRDLTEAMAQMATEMRQTSSELKESLSEVRRVAKDFSTKSEASWGKAVVSLTEGAEHTEQAAKRLLEHTDQLTRLGNAVETLNKSLADFSGATAQLTQAAQNHSVQSSRHAEAELAHASAAMTNLRTATEQLYRLARELGYRLP
jgi:hypothetical protein